MAAPKKPAVKKEEVKVEKSTVEIQTPEKELPIKYVHEFNSWEEYHAYKGPKG